MEKIIGFMKREMVLTLAAVLAVISCFFRQPSLSYINFKVLIMLFNLMIVTAAFKEMKVLDNMAVQLLRRCRSERMTAFSLVFMTFFFSMLMTNDVALITFVPFTLLIGKKINKNVLHWVVFQTLAANMGSTLTPMGNPQNLYIYSHYGLEISEFLKVTLPVTAGAAAFLGLLMLCQKDSAITFEMEEIKIQKPVRAAAYALFFIMVMGCVLGFVNDKLVLGLIVLTTIVLDRSLFKKVDYSLLLTFVAFFVFVGNLSKVEAIKEAAEHLLGTVTGTYLVSLGLSQVISNVPATMLLSGFTDKWQALVLGVDIGGMGTLIASLASVISYKLYVKENPAFQGKYLRVFTLYNVLGLLVLGITFGIILL